jgi:hypothetical protein
MDNDQQIIHEVKEFIKSIKFKFDYKNKKILEGESGNDFIYQKLCSNESFMVGRFGTVEARCVAKWIHGRKYSDYNITSINEAADFSLNLLMMKHPNKKTK